MNFIIPTIGSRGDVQPYIALSVALQAAGHRAVIATHPCMRQLIERYGVPFAPIGPDIDIGKEAALMRERAPHWIVGLNRVMKFSFSMLEQSHTDLIPLCEEADVVIVSHTAAGSIEADKLAKPKLSVALFPQAIPVHDPAEPLIKRAVGAAAGWGMGWMMSRPLDRIRRRLGVPPMGPEGITSRTLNLLPISPLVFEPDSRWEPRHKMTGYWFADPPGDWTPPDDLQAFIEAGEPPVVISLGAMALAGSDTLEAARMTLAALSQIDARAIIQGWDAAMRQLDLPPTVFHAGSIPHTWLLPRASCIVHHGGFGTTAAAFRAGIPAVIIPHIIDQFIWGQRVHELGVGPEPIPRKKLTTANLAAALSEAVHDEGMQSRAAELGHSIRAEKGLETAVRLIEEAVA